MYLVYQRQIFFGDGSNLTNISASIEGNISVNNATIGGNLYVGGTVTVAGVGIFESDVSVSGDLDVATNASIGGTFTATGATQLGWRKVCWKISSI